MLIINYPVPTNVKVVRVSPLYFRALPVFALSCLQNGFHANFLSPPLTLVCEILAKLAFFRAFSLFIEILLPGCYCQFGTNILIKMIYRLGHFLCPFTWHSWLASKEAHPGPPCGTRPGTRPIVPNWPPTLHQVNLSFSWNSGPHCFK